MKVLLEKLENNEGIGSDDKKFVIQTACIDWLLGAIHREGEESSTYDSQKIYWQNVNYEEAGVPSGGERMFVAHRFDPRALQQWQGQNLNEFNKKTLRGGRRQRTQALVPYVDQKITVIDQALSLSDKEISPFILSKIFQFTMPQRSAFGRYSENSFFIEEMSLADMATTTTNINTQKRNRNILISISEVGVLSPAGISSWAFDKDNGYVKSILKKAGGSWKGSAFNLLIRWVKGQRKSRTKKEVRRLLQAFHGGAPNIPLAMDLAETPFHGRRKKDIMDENRITATVAQQVEKKRVEKVRQLHIAALQMQRDDQCVGKISLTSDMLKKASSKAKDGQLYQTLFDKRRTREKKKLARLFHPDKRGGSKEQFQAFMQCGL